MSDLFAALAKAQGALHNVGFDKTNPHFKSKYASLAAVLDVIRKPLADNGLSITQVLCVKDNGERLLQTTLRHATGDDCVDSFHPLPGNVTAQQFGSALTYARRYSLTALLNVSADDDDDGNAANDGRARKPKEPAPNVMVAHDQETGEITESAAQSSQDAVADTAPEDTPNASGAALSLEDMAREAAMRGEPTFKAFYKSRSAQEKKILNGMGDELRGLMAGANMSAG